MSQNQIATAPFQTDLELSQVAQLFLQRLADKTQDLLSKDWFLSAIVQKAGISDTSSKVSFPSRVIVRSHSCGAPIAGMERFAAEHLCVNGGDRFDEIIIQDFGHWNLLTNQTCRDCVADFMLRQRQFTLGSLEAPLMTGGYKSVGIVQEQKFEHGFPSPFAYSGYVREGEPLIIVGHIPQNSGATDELTHPVREFRFFFPG